MSRRYPLSYPAPAQAKFHAQINEEIPHDYYRVVFCSSFMSGPFKKISGHGTIPIILGAAATATGHSYMLVRSIAVLSCAIWLSLDVGVWLSETKWSKRWAILAFCVSSASLCCSAMGLMYWFLDSTLGDQQNDVYAKLTMQPFMPISRNVLRTGITITNGGGTDIKDHRILCFLRRVTFAPYGGISGLGMSTTLPEKSGLRAYGDGETSYCIAGIQAFPPDTHAVCADITVIVAYSLETQPEVSKKKEFRLVADGEDFVFHQQPIDYPGDYCPEPKLP